MRSHFIVCGVFGLIGCDDTAMNLGPDSTSAAGGMDTTLGTTTTATASGGSSAPPQSGGGATTPSAGGTGTGLAGSATAPRVSTNGGNLGTGTTQPPNVGGQAGAAPVSGLALGGLERFRYLIDPSHTNPWTDGSSACQGTELSAYTLDLLTKTLAYEHCAASTDGLTPTTIVESHDISDPQATASLILLEHLTLSHASRCGADKSVNSLTLDFGHRQDVYLDDFYAGCPNRTGTSLPDPIFVSNLDDLGHWLKTTWSMPALPTDYDRVTLSEPPTSEVLTTWTVECGTSFVREFEVDFENKQALERDCSRTFKLGETTNGPAAITTRTTPLTDDRLEYLRTWIARLELGATRACSSAGAFAARARFLRGTEEFPELVDASVACPEQSWYPGLLTLNVNDLYWVVNEIFYPAL